MSMIKVMRYNTFKLLVLILCCYMLCLAFNSEQSFSFGRYFPDGEISYYTLTKIEGGQNFDCAGLFCNSQTSPNIEVVGESIVVPYEDLHKYISTLNAQIIRKEYLTQLNLTLLYAHSPVIDCKLKDTTTNLQIAVYSDHAVIGWPMIYGSF